jgi:hypothetical protein
MAYKKMPSVKTVIEPETYNVLMSALEKWTHFKGTEDNLFATRAKHISEKIQTYARPFTDKDGHNFISVHYFENEAADLIELLIFSLFPYEDTDSVHYKNLMDSRRGDDNF